jgi:outer membrane protein assembly factor BamB
MIRFLGGFVLVVAAGSAWAADKGATAYQVTPAHNAAVTFSDSWGPNLKTLWTATLDGAVSSPLVSKDAVYAVVAGEPTEIVRLDAHTGKMLWRSSAGGETIVGLAYDEGALFVMTSGGALSAYAAKSGKRLWTTIVVAGPYYAAGPSALNGIVYVSAGAGNAGLYALDETSGKVIWSQTLIGFGASNPAVTSKGVYVSYTCLYSDFDPKTGVSIWQDSGSCSNYAGTTPVVNGNKVFTLGSPNNVILAADTGATIGSFAATLPPAVHGRLGYFMDSGTLSAVNPTTSRLFWEFTGDGLLNALPLAVNGYVLTASYSHLYVLNGSTGVVESTVSLQGQYSVQALGAGEGMILVPQGSTLVAYGSTT